MTIDELIEELTRLEQEREQWFAKLQTIVDKQQEVTSKAIELLHRMKERDADNWWRGEDEPNA